MQEDDFIQVLKRYDGRSNNLFDTVRINLSQMAFTQDVAREYRGSQERGYVQIAYSPKYEAIRLTKGSEQTAAGAYASSYHINRATNGTMYYCALPATLKKLHIARGDYRRKKDGPDNIFYLVKGTK